MHTNIHSSPYHCTVPLLHMWLRLSTTNAVESSLKETLFIIQMFCTHTLSLSHTHTNIYIYIYIYIYGNRINLRPIDFSTYGNLKDIFETTF